MDDLTREVAQRNARFRAWRAQGMPLEAAWELRGRRRAVLTLRCTVCQTGACKEAWSARSLPRAEGDALAFADCAHLAPLHEPDPPEVRAIFELELLAG